MTENLLQKLEEKVTTLLTELETLRSEFNLLKIKNVSLINEKTDSTKKLQELIALLDAADMTDQSLIASELHVLQESNEYASA